MLALPSCERAAPDPWVFRVQTDLAPGIEVEELRLGAVEASGTTRIVARLGLYGDQDWATAPRELATLMPHELTPSIVAFDVIALDIAGNEVSRAGEALRNPVVVPGGVVLHRGRPFALRGATDLPPHGGLRDAARARTARRSPLRPRRRVRKRRLRPGPARSSGLPARVIDAGAVQG